MPSGRMYQDLPSQRPSMDWDNSPVNSPAATMRQQQNWRGLANALAQGNPVGGFGGGGMGIPGGWSYTPQQPSYAGAIAQQGLGNTLASMYGTEGSLQGLVQSLPWQLAGTASQAVNAADANKYAANQAAMSGAWQSYYPAEAAVQTAHYGPWADLNAARINALAGQNIAQMNNEARLAGQAHMFNQLPGLLQQVVGLQQPVTNISTGYGAGVNYA